MASQNIPLVAMYQQASSTAIGRLSTKTPRAAGASSPEIENAMESIPQDGGIIR